MKNNYTFLELFGDIDEKFIYEASRPWKKQVIIKYRLLKTAVAGFILLFLAAGTMTHQEEVKAAWKHNATIATQSPEADATRASPTPPVIAVGTAPSEPNT